MGKKGGVWVYIGGVSKSVWGAKFGVWGHRYLKIWGWIRGGFEGFLGSEIELNWGEGVVGAVWGVFESRTKECVMAKLGQILGSFKAEYKSDKKSYLKMTDTIAWNHMTMGKLVLTLKKNI